jgi:hypothetical protein
MTDKTMTLIERLRNPAWEADGPTTEAKPAKLNVTKTLATMAEAAAEIESLKEAYEDALNPRSF